MDNKSLRYIRVLLAVSLLMLTAGTGLSLAYNIRKTRYHHLEDALFSARSFHRSIVAARMWNAAHGGLYMVVDDTIQPNPYLKAPDRDIVSTTGRKLTKVNPAYMTRMISEVMSRKYDVGFHITSLNPLNPGNRADQWESESLKSFETGTKETFAKEMHNNEPVFRFMAPLVTEKACLSCHREQGYREGDVRGGISVFFPYLSFQKAQDDTVRSLVLSHSMLYILSAAFMLLLGTRYIQKLREITESSETIRKLESLLPICSYCKKIRIAESDPEDQKSWVRFEQFFQEKSSTEFSHGVCPECAQKYFPDDDGGHDG